jgi:DNA/RNA-binding domain of Phe-tRNA-synthetase-like protein
MKYWPGVYHLSMEKIHFTDTWHATFPGGHIGLLLMGPVDNARRKTPLDDYKRTLEETLRQNYGQMTRADLLALDALKAYKTYYRKFNKTYHVQLQLESVLHKGKSLPNINPLVDACFAAELETHLLTASHDADTLKPPVHIDASTGSEQLLMMNGKRKQIKAGDMMMTDADGVVCTIIYGQDKRTPVTEHTRRVLYVTYVPAGITADTVSHHHEILIRNVRLFAPEATAVSQRIVTAGK